jgi:hypothetical protein
MAEGKKKSSWVFPSAGPGTFSGFFVAWVFVAGIIGLALALMAIGKGPMPIRVVAYDISLDGKPPAQTQLDTLAAAMGQTNPMVLVLQGSSEEFTKALALKLEIKDENVASQGSSAILTRYTIEKAEGARVALIRYGKNGRFGVVNVDLSQAGSDGKLQEAVNLAKTQFGETPHAIFALVNGVPPAPPAGYVNAPIAIPGKEEVSSHWHAFIPEAIEDNLKECYLPADNETIQKYSDRLPLVTRFVFHKEDFK